MMKKLFSFGWLTVVLCGVLTSAFTAPATLEAGIFDGTPKAVTLPDCTKDELVGLVPLETAGKPIAMELLGGETAIPPKASAKKKKKNADSEVTGFTMEQDEPKEGKDPTWKIKFNQKGKKATSLILSHDGKTLNCKWNTKVPQKLLLPIGNCVLKITCESETHFLALREPIKLESIVLNPKTASGAIKGTKMQIPFPALETVFVEILNLGSYLPGDSSVVIPPATKASEIGPQTPLQIKFSFTDPNGNVSSPLQFDVVPNFGNGFSASILPPKEWAKQLPAMIQNVQNPQFEIQINKIKQEISTTKQKLEKEEAWKRNAADTSKIANLEQQLWLYDKLKTIANADAKIRIYVDYGEFQADLIVTETLTVEQKAEKKTASKGGKKEKAAAAPEDENDLGGLKF